MRKVIGAERAVFRGGEGQRVGNRSTFAFLIDWMRVKGAVFRNAIAIDKFQLSAGSGGEFLTGKLLTQSPTCEFRGEETGSSNYLISDVAADVLSSL